MPVTATAATILAGVTYGTAYVSGNRHIRMVATAIEGVNINGAPVESTLEPVKSESMTVCRLMRGNFAVPMSQAILSSCHRLLVHVCVQPLTSNLF